MAKRVSDVVLSGLGLILLSPLFLTIAILIKIDSPGPVFYTCKRIGKKARPFKFYKFRSMVENAERMRPTLMGKNEKDGPIFKIKKDPRITRVGKFLRKYSLDELPQLWNVVKGDMSLVGPRPPLVEEVEKYQDWQLRRLDVTPGMTCLWQISGRSDLPFGKWVDLDIYYIENWSLWLDTKILFRTVPAIFKAKGAY